MSLNLALLAADIAARVPAMAQDCAINNATMIEGLIRNELERVEGKSSRGPLDRFEMTFWERMGEEWSRERKEVKAP